MLHITEDMSLDVSSGIYAIKFWADWCGPCKKISPLLTQLETEFPSVNFISVDTDETSSLAQKYKVRTLPTVLFLNDGEEVERVTGMAMMEPLRTLFKGVTSKQ